MTSFRPSAGSVNSARDTGPSPLSSDPGVPLSTLVTLPFPSPDSKVRLQSSSLRPRTPGPNLFPPIQESRSSLLSQTQECRPQPPPSNSRVQVPVLLPQTQEFRLQSSSLRLRSPNQGLPLQTQKPILKPFSLRLGVHPTPTFNPYPPATGSWNPAIQLASFQSSLLRTETQVLSPSLALCLQILEFGLCSPASGPLGKQNSLGSAC